MVNLKEMTITIGDYTSKIVKLTVWFETPMGLFDDLILATKALESADLPMLALRAVPVAIGENNIYEVL